MTGSLPVRSGVRPPGSFSAPDEPQLLASGWERRFLADKGRADETAELYRSMGLEVLVTAPSPAKFAENCEGCAATVCASYVIVYTRARNP